MEGQGWRLVAASAIGTSHLKTDAPCQDAFAWDVLGDLGDIVVLSAADGAGSASQSETGAQLAVQEILDCARAFFGDGRTFDELTSGEALSWMKSAVARIDHRATEDELPIREYACTLLTAVVSPTHACFFQVGDGAMVVRPRGDEWAYIFWPQHGEYINATCFVTDPQSLERFEFSCNADRIEEVALFTDGIEALVLGYANREVHGPFFDKMFQAVRGLTAPGFDQPLSEGLQRFLESPMICERTDDDKTLMLASWSAPTADAHPEPEEE